MYFELHVTLLGDKEALRAKVEEAGWKFSCIDGDPSLGPGVKCYATKQLNARGKLIKVISGLEMFADHAKTFAEVLRTKVEIVVYDNIRGEKKEEWVEIKKGEGE